MKTTCTINGKHYKLVKQDPMPKEENCVGCVAMGDDDEHWNLCYSLPYCRIALNDYRIWVEDTEKNSSLISK